MFQRFTSCLQALTEEQLKRVEGHTNFCAEQTEISYEMAKAFRFAVIPEGESNECFAKCFMTRLGFMDDDGIMNKQKMLQVIGVDKDDETKAKLSNLIKKCTTLSGDSICSTAFKVHNCYYKHVCV